MNKHPNTITIFTDGSSLGNPGPGGWGALIIMPDSQVYELGGRDSSTTNNRMELTAAIEALLKLKAIEASFEAIEIHTDSTYVKNGISSWVYTWERNNWITSTKESVQNQDLWQTLLELARYHHNQGKIAWEKVKGHDGILGNERVDRIATEFAASGTFQLFTGGLPEYESIIGGHVFSKDATSKPKKAKSKKTQKQAYSYVSFVDGQIFYDATWAECEKRVKGVAGAKYKKAMDAKDEMHITKEFTEEYVNS